MRIVVLLIASSLLLSDPIVYPDEVGSSASIEVTPATAPCETIVNDAIADFADVGLVHAWIEANVDDSYSVGNASRRRARRHRLTRHDAR